MCVPACSVSPLDCKPTDYSQPGSSVHGLFQARILKWVAISYSRGSSQTRDRSTSLVSNSYQNTRRLSLDIDKINLKIIWKGKISRIAKQFWRRGKKQSTKNFKTYYTAMETKGEGNGTPLQHSCLENPMDRGAWWATVHGVAKSQTQLKWLSTAQHVKKCLTS